MLKKMLVVTVLSAITAFAAAGENDARNTAMQGIGSSSASNVSAAQGLTRAQVIAELIEAERTGDIMDGNSGKKLNELYPDLYPAKPVVQGKTREQVLAELADAQRTGDLIDGRTDEKLNELYPDLYPAKVVVQGKTREQVQVELTEAERTGDILDGRTDKKLYELYPHLYPRHS